jgi:hypothetical protein
MSSVIYFQILLFQTGRRCLVWWTVSLTQEACRTESFGRLSVLSNDSLDVISQTLVRFPRKSLRNLSLQSGLSYGSVHKAAKILEFHPHRIRVLQRLNEPEKGRRLQNCVWFTHFIGGGIDISDRFLIVSKHSSTKPDTLIIRAVKYEVTCVLLTLLQKLFTRLHQTWGKHECMNRWTRWTIRALNMILCFWFSAFSIFLTNRTCVRNCLRVAYLTERHDPCFFFAHTDTSHVRAGLSSS